MSLCEHCGHVESQCQCGKMSKDGREIKVNFTRLFCGWWKKAKKDHEERINGNLRDGK